MAREKKVFKKPSEEEKLVFGEHHRFISKEPREKRKFKSDKKKSTKKQIRDMERLIKHKGMSQEI